MTDSRRTPFRDKWRTFADIHRASQEDWILALFQRLCKSVQNLDWASPQFDESKLTTAQNLVCVDKCFKRWREDSNAINALSSPRSNKPYTSTPFQPSSAPASFLASSAPNSTITFHKLPPSSSKSPPRFGSSEILVKIEGMDIVDADDDNPSFNSSLSSHDISSSMAINPIYAAPDPTSDKYDLKKKHVDIINYTIESKYKAIKALVERVARGIHEKRNVNFVLLWLLIENRAHLEGVKYNTVRIHSGNFTTQQVFFEFKREVINSYEAYSGFLENGNDESDTNGTSPLKANGDTDLTWKTTSPATTKGGWNRVVRPVVPVLEPKEVRLPPPAMLRNAKPAEILKEGWMKKQSDKSRTWKRRYFILSTDAILAYFQISARKPGILGSHHNNNSTSTGSAPHSPGYNPSSNAPSSPPPSLPGSHTREGKVLGKMKASYDIWRVTQIGSVRDLDATLPAASAVFGMEMAPDRKLRLWCETDKDMEEWLEVLLKMRAQSRW